MLGAPCFRVRCRRSRLSRSYHVEWAMSTDSSPSSPTSCGSMRRHSASKWPPWARTTQMLLQLETTWAVSTGSSPSSPMPCGSMRRHSASKWPPWARTTQRLLEHEATSPVVYNEQSKFDDALSPAPRVRAKRSTNNTLFCMHLVTKCSTFSSKLRSSSA